MVVLFVSLKQFIKNKTYNDDHHQLTITATVMTTRDAVVVCKGTVCIQHGDALVLGTSGIFIEPAEVFTALPLKAARGAVIPAQYIICHLLTIPVPGVYVIGRAGKINLWKSMGDFPRQKEKI